MFCLDFIVNLDYVCHILYFCTFLETKDIEGKFLTLTEEVACVLFGL